jgi:hypothetical protein
LFQFSKILALTNHNYGDVVVRQERTNGAGLDFERKKRKKTLDCWLVASAGRRGIGHFSWPDFCFINRSGGEVFPPRKFEARTNERLSKYGRLVLDVPRE